MRYEQDCKDFAMNSSPFQEHCDHEMNAEYDQYDGQRAEAQQMAEQEEYEMAEEKRRLQTQLRSLDQDVRTEARHLRDNEPRAADQLEEAVTELMKY